MASSGGSGILKSFWDCTHGPQLNRILRGAEAEGYKYTPNLLEYCSNGIIKSLRIVWSIGLYTSPLILPVLYKKGYFVYGRFLSLLKSPILGLVGILFVGSFFIRGLGRCRNPDYKTFMVALNNAKSNMCHDTKKQLARYDFSFWAWPIEFSIDQVEGESKKKSQSTSKYKGNTTIENITALPCQLLSYAIAHTIGRRLLYPGSLQILQSAMEPMLLQGRARLVEEYNGERFKLQSRETNTIDTMLVDRRGNAEHANGDILVICCEGNAGFYEMGIMETPLKSHYSVLGWNHPGFGGSTGEAFPEQEQNAIDVVIQFAIHKLGFKLQNIVLYAWSIGGYTATWAATTYPEVNSLILDATFDDLLPLAIAQMPRSWKPLVVRTVREYLNLNVAVQLCQYNGPVRLIRRTKDEVITIGGTQEVKDNRGNILLTKVLQWRYPILLSSSEAQNLLGQWLAREKNDQLLLWREYEVDEDLCESLVDTQAAQEEGAYPSGLGIDLNSETKLQLVLFLASKYMSDFDATHCQPLPADMFFLPWNPWRAPDS